MIRRLTSADAAEFTRLRREALEREPFAFGASPNDDFAGSIDHVSAMLDDKVSSAVFGAYEPNLVGIVGVRRLTRQKARHRADLWGMYVRHDHRGKGLGRALVEAAIAWSREQDGLSWLCLSVTQQGQAAARLYERLGFCQLGG